MSDDRPVVVSDPGIRFGDPCVRGVSTNDLGELWVAGWTVAAYPVLSGWDKRHVDEVPMPPLGSAVSGATCPSP